MNPPTAWAVVDSEPSSIVAAGFVNVVESSPNGLRAVAGTDVAGVFRSTSTAVGEVWASANESIMAKSSYDLVPQHSAVASVGWRDDSQVFAVTGRGGSPSYLLRSTNQGVTWDHVAVSDPATFQVIGSNYGGSGSNSHPRGTGRLIGFGTATGSTLVYVAGMDRLARMTVSGGPGPVTGGSPAAEVWSGEQEAVSMAVTPGDESGGAAGTDTVWALMRDSNAPDGPDDDTDGDDLNPWTSQQPNNGLIKVSAANGTMNQSGLLRPACVPATARPAELIAIREGAETAVYVAWGKWGVFRYKNGGWKTVAKPSGSPCNDGGATLPAEIDGWTAIDAYKARAGLSTGPTVLVIGGIPNGCAAPPCDALMRLSVTWAGPATTPVSLVTAPSEVKSTLAGSTTPWWHIVDPGSSDPPAIASSDAKVGYKSWVTAMVDIVDSASSSSSLTMLVSGRGGIWKGTYTASPQTREWEPAGRGLANTYSKGVAVEQGDPTHMMSVDGDWQVIRSIDAFAATPPHKHMPSNAVPVNAQVIAFDPVGGVVVGYSNARVYYNPDPYGGALNCWSDLGKPAGADGTGIVGIVAANSDAAANKTRVVGAFRTGTGSALGQFQVEFTRTCSPVITPGGWTSTEDDITGPDLVIGGDSSAMGGGAAPKHVAYTRNTTGQTIYRFDQYSGLAKSTNYGKNWSAMAGLTAFGGPSGGDDSGWMAAAPGSPNTLYLTFGKTAFKVNASACGPTSCTPVVLSFTGLALNSRNFGGVAIDNTGRAVIANLPADAVNNTDIQLLQAASAAAVVLADVADATYRAHVFHNNQLVASGSTVFSANDGTGLLRIAVP